MMKKHFAIILFSLFACQFANAQEKPKFWDRIYFGGNLGLSFGSNSTVVDVSPIVGYKITERLSVGFGVTYIYYHVKIPSINYSYETSIYGGDVFTRYFFFDNLFGHVEAGALNLDVPSQFFPYTLKREWIPNFLLGAGYRAQMGEHSSFMIMLLYDVIDDPNSPFQNPIFRVGFGFGI